MRDPIIGKLNELEQRQLQAEAQARVDRQLQELVAKHPEVLQEGLPQEAQRRFAIGGVTLTEAYRLTRPQARHHSRTAEEAKLMQIYGLTINDLERGAKNND